MDILQAEEESLVTIMAEATGSTSTMSSMLISKRIRAVRSEVINALSFLSVVLTLHKEEAPSVWVNLFFASGLLILLIDCYFIHCQWMLKTNHGLPILCTTILRQRSRKVQALDDLLSDLPQSIWVLCYLVSFKFSLIAVVCALHSTFSIAEGIFKLKD
jgi:hypothetical protein